MKYTSKDTGLEQALRSPDEDEAKLLNSVSSRMRVSMAEARDSCTGISRKLLVGLGFAALLIQESRAVLGRENSTAPLVSHGEPELTQAANTQTARFQTTIRELVQMDRNR